uniref:Uncharacterized protein n=1 Tax=Romanomermis culicivorax TaxID=13658 RepID=A0A915JMG3_ROMCU
MQRKIGYTPCTPRCATPGILRCATPGWASPAQRGVRNLFLMFKKRLNSASKCFFRRCSNSSFVNFFLPPDSNDAFNVVSSAQRPAAILAAEGEALRRLASGQNHTKSLPAATGVISSDAFCFLGESLLSATPAINFSLVCVTPLVDFRAFNSAVRWSKSNGGEINLGADGEEDEAAFSNLDFRLLASTSRCNLKKEAVKPIPRGKSDSNLVPPGKKTKLFIKKTT